MSWTCPRCTERLEAEFVQCWRCGYARKLTSLEEANLAAHEAATSAAEADEKRQIQTRADFIELVHAYESEQGWNRPTFDRATHAGQALHRLVTAHRLRRSRRNSDACARPDLDRRWAVFYIATALLTALLTGILLAEPWADWLMEQESRFFWVYLPLLFGTVITGGRAVKAELRAAAEDAVTMGWRPSAT